MFNSVGRCSGYDECPNLAQISLSYHIGECLIFVDILTHASEEQAVLWMLFYILLVQLTTF